MKKLHIHHELVSAMALVACIAVHTNVYSSTKNEGADVDSTPVSSQTHDKRQEEEALLEVVQPESLKGALVTLGNTPLLPPARVIDEKEREEAFQSGRVAFFKTTGAKPTLHVYDPLNAEVIASTFDKNLLYLKPLSSAKYDLAGYKVYEDFYDSSAKATFVDKAMRSTSTPAYASPFFMLYLKNVPTCLVLKDEKELSLLVAHMRMLFERSGLTPSIQKPLLVVSIDGKTTELPGLFGDAEFLHKYFYLASFADEEVQRAFLDRHTEMLEKVTEVNQSKATKYPNDGFFGGFARDINKAAHGFNATKLSIQGTTAVVTLVSGGIIGGLLKEPVMNFFKDKTQKGLVDPMKEKIQKGVVDPVKEKLGKTTKPETTSEEKEKAELIDKIIPLLPAYSKQQQVAFINDGESHRVVQLQKDLATLTHKENLSQLATEALQALYAEVLKAKPTPAPTT